MENGPKKIFAGPKIRRLRRELGLTQSQMAGELGFSSSYVNLVERNQRPVSAQFLLRMAEVYDVELRSLAGNEDAKIFADLTEALSDPLFGGIELMRSEVQDFTSASPQGAEAFIRLYRAYRESKERTADLSSRVADRENSGHGEEIADPMDEVREYIHAQRNYFPELDEAAEDLNMILNLGLEEPYGTLAKRLEGEHDIRVRIMASHVLPDTLRHFDHHRKQLMLSELIRRSGRTFHIAYQIGLLEQREAIDRLVAKASLRSDEAERLLRISLANYFAAALLMPYEKFLSDAEDIGYDIEHLGKRFGASFEQVCHRLTTLQRPGTKGIPFFFIRVDNAGNISKRFSAGRFHFSRFGGTCPLWNVHDTFASAGRIRTQVIRMPDETTYFSVARTVSRSGTPYKQTAQQLAIGLGCDLSYAPKLVYSRGYNLDEPDVTPVGPNCRLCERPACAQRAHPPLTRPMVLDERSRGVSPFRFTQE